MAHEMTAKKKNWRLEIQPGLERPWLGEFQIRSGTEVCRQICVAWMRGCVWFEGQVPTYGVMCLYAMHLG